MTTGRELDVNLSKLLGLNNRAPDFRLSTEIGSFLRAASNALISDAGTAKRRAGYTQVFAGADAHSFWVDAVTDTGFYADGATLYRVNGLGGLYRQALVADLNAGRSLTYTRVGTDIIFSDGAINRCIGTDGVRPFGVPILSGAPVIVGLVGGALSAGSYQVSIAFANIQSEFSGASPPVLIDIPNNGKITLSGLPETWPVGADTLIVYVSAPGGSSLFSERVIRTPQTSIDIVVISGIGMLSETLDMDAMPPGRILRHFASRLYVAAGPTLYYSGIYSPALYMPAKGYVTFLAPITIMEPCDGGMFVVADKTYWMAGDIVTAELKEVSPCGAVFGTTGRVPHSTDVFWMSTQGLMKGKSTGEVVLLQDENVVVPRASAGASILLEEDGQRHAISALSNADPGAAAARSYMSAEIIRKGTTL